MKKWLLCGSTGLVAISLAAWYFWPAPFPVRAYERIRLGMTPDEVEAVIGMPPGNYGSRPDSGSSGPQGKCLRQAGTPLDVVRDHQPELFAKGDYWSEGWEWKEYSIGVVYDRSNRLVGFYLMEGWPWFRDRSDFLDRLRAWLGL